MQAIILTGNPGDRLSYEIKVDSQEKKPVYAHAVSDQDWLQPEKARLNGRVAVMLHIRTPGGRPLLVAGGTRGSSRSGTWPKST